MKRELSQGFFAAYHASLFASTGDEAKRVNAKTGAHLASMWQKKTGNARMDAKAFKEALEASFKDDFRFSDVAELSVSDDASASLRVEGCAICPGNEILRTSGKSGVCPISQFVKSAMARALNKGVELTGSEKPGPIGECVLKYRIAD